ncbi:hypothetical protein EDC94DRAFT_655854 [Helicostylum pulchrum]|nr:hypothetical protein EDC94DRAFT_655854 [Helicostylum pulchrum]
MPRSLKECNMWRLSSGRYVEEVMMQIFVKGSEEHPVWSLLMNASDEKYKAYFSEEELEEIKYQSVFI